MKKLQLLIPKFTLFIFIVALAVAVSPAPTKANFDWDDCDVPTLDTTYTLGNVQAYCYPIVLDQTRTLYGITVHIHSIASAGTYYINFLNRSEAQSGIWGTTYEDAVTLSAAGEYTFTMETPRVYTAGETPYFYISDTSGTFNGSSGLTQFSAISGDNKGSYAIWYWDTPPPPEDTSTRIISVTPPHDVDGSLARATSTVFAIEATGYVNPDDFKEGMYVKIDVRNDAGIPTASLAGPAFSDGGAAICNWMWDWLCPPTVDDDTNIIGAQTTMFHRTYTQEITAATNWSFATTTNVQQIGWYTMKTEVITPRDGLFDFAENGHTLVASTTQFLVATSTWYDTAHDEAVALANSLTSGNNTYNCEVNFSTLFGILDIGDCIKYMFAGSDGIIVTYVKESIAGLTIRAPWGYATRVYTIFTQPTATSTLPSIAADIPDGLPLAGSHVDFSPWAGTESAVAMFGSTAIPDAHGNPTSGSVLSNFLHWWNIMWLIVFALWIMKEIYGAYELGDFEDVGFVGGNAHGRIRKDVHGRKYQEWSTKDIKRFTKKGDKRGDGWGGGKGVIH